MKAFKLDRLSLAIASALGFMGVAHAQLVVNDTLTGGHSMVNWKALNGACLTAGDNGLTPSDGTQLTPSTPTLTIPKCTGLAYYSGKTLVGGATGVLPDATGQGALRLSNGDTTTGSNGNNQTGAVVSNFTFPTNEGLQVTWTSVTYGGNAYQNNHANTNSDGTAYDNKSGADGISFFLSDGGTTAKPIDPTVGALGGSLGYSCSNGNGTYDGVVGGYLGIGMDEFGNFANKGDNTNTGPAQTAGAITVRGAGHTAFKWLNDNYKSWYPDSLALPANNAARMTAIQTTCKTGLLYNFSGGDVSVTVPTYYTATYTYTRHSGTTTGTITSSTAIPSSSSCDNDGTPNSSGARSCTYTNITTVNTQTVATGTQIPSTIVGSAYKLDYNYPWLSTNTFPQGSYIFNQEALGTDTSGASKAVRSKATPITYSLLITQTGLLTFTYSIGGGSPFTVFNGMNITASNGPLPSSFRFGFSAGTGGGSNVHEITCFKAAPANTSSSTAGSNVQSGKVQSDSQIYLAYYHPTNSWGSLTAQSLVFTAATSTTSSALSVSPTVNWDAGCVLTGGNCLSQSNAVVNAPLTNATRTILSWDGTKGVPFRWANMTSTSGGQQTALTAGDATATTDRLDYLRGDRTKEVTGGGAFRNRTSLLGDIVDSSPVWLGPPNLNYSAAWSDLLNPTTTMPEGTSYAAFKTTYAGRLNVVYAGANDGMLHGFQAGAYSNGALVQANNTGKEVLSYVPSQVVSTIHSTTAALDFANPSYSHNFFVDASPATGDLYYAGGWHSWVVSGLGPGGQAAGPIADTTSVATGSVFALEVTDPSTFSETAAQSIVKGEWSSASLNASGSLCNVSNCGDRLGATYGTPSIRRLHDGTWGVIFGNGLNSKNGTAGIFIVHVNPSTGATQSVQYIDTGSGSTSSRNGIVQVTPVDLDGDHVTDYLYAGDLQGHVWRFDLTSTSSSSWAMKSTPVFTTQSGQPITTGVAVDAVTTMADTGALSTQPRVIIAFGTGNKLPQTLTADASYPTTRQSIYGVWDADMSSWNGKAAAQYQYASLTSPPTVVPGSGSSGNMLVHTITTTSGVRSTDQKVAVCWQGSTSCASATNNQMGWELDLTLNAASGSTPAAAEQVLYNPMVAGHYFNTNTALPTVAQALTCDSSKQTAYSIGISMATGGAGAGVAGTVTTATSSGTTTATNNFSYFTNYPAGTIGVSTGAVGTSSLVTASDGTQYLVYNTTDGTGGTQPVTLPPDSSATGTASRLTWTKMR